MEKYERFEIKDATSLKRPTIYFFLKENKFSEHYIKNLRGVRDAFLLNDKPVTVREKLKNGDILQIAKSPNKKTEIAECEGKLDILFEDDDYLIVNKPAMLACTPTRSHYSMNLGGQICKYMKSKDEHFVLRILNRLDRETAGIVVVAKNVIAYKEMQNFRKTYHALCSGNVEKDFTINAPILTVTNDGINQMKRIVSPEGKHAVTHARVIKNFDTFSLVQLTLETGRTHQIRVHMAHVGRPLLGDTLYGTAHPQTPHTMLLLKEISFTHFRTEALVHLQVPYPTTPPLWKWSAKQF